MKEFNIFMVIFALGMITFVFLTPFITIMAINNVFGLEIELNLWTWLGMTWLQVLFGVMLSNRSFKSE
jgi:hypothetical protein